jgi:general secretion pathway protein J
VTVRDHPEQPSRTRFPATSRTCTRGLTLIELVAATAIFALVSVMAMQALTGGLIQRAGIERADADQAALLRTLALLRQDLQAAVPLPHLPAAGPVGPPLDIGPGGFALSRAGIEPLPGQSGDGFARVIWRVDPNAAQLLRQMVPLTGASGPLPTEVAMLPEVTSLRLIPRGDWPGAPEGLPPGLEAVIETRSQGTLRVVVAR